MLAFNSILQNWFWKCRNYVLIRYFILIDIVWHKGVVNVNGLLWFYSVSDWFMFAFQGFIPYLKTPKGKRHIILECKINNVG